MPVQTADRETMQKTLEMLNMLQQEHIAKYILALDEQKQQELVAQIQDLDLSVLAQSDTVQKRGSFTPLCAVTVPQIRQEADKYKKTGLEAIRAGKVGAVLLAGGQGSRLGYDHPKGTFNIGETRSLSIFECLINNLHILWRIAEQLVCHHQLHDYSCQAFRTQSRWRCKLCYSILAVRCDNKWRNEGVLY